MSDVGRLIAGRYRLAEQIGRGGMGTVWRAEDELLDRQVAVKQLHVSPHLSEEELTTMHERTRREARSAARITHPNVVVVHDVVDDGGLPCIVMEYVPSTTLGDLLKEGGTLSPEETARIGRGMIAALRAAHEAGVLHRDVKPGNVLLGANGRVVLTDFGIAMATGTSTLTKTGEVVGSIDYIAPERVRGRKPGPASDLWALGATLYQAVEGRAPFRKPTPIETGYAIAVDPLEPPKRAGALGPLIEALLAKEPEQRPSAEQTERALRGPASEPTTTGYPVQGDQTTATTMVLMTARTPAPPPEPEPPRQQDPTPPTPVPAPVLSPAPLPKGPRTFRWTAVGTALAVVAVAGGVYVWKTGDGTPSASGASAGVSSSPSPSFTPSPVPEGYRMVKGLGVSFPVPGDWQPDADSDGKLDGTQEVRYLDPAKMAQLSINVLDFASNDQVKHFEDVEAKLKSNVIEYERTRLQETTYRGMPAAIWEFRFKGRARWFRAIDLGFGNEGDKEYAIYLSAPEDQWSQYRPIFDKVRDGIHLP
ncbi:serine/threonine-protein kinase [Streptomyces sp. NBRC 110028]|uniref:serine/threonine-protein kinase n=1 Tax=Streptomyces sp. NBRC 110028 TaxID=1621260 RepID=UPI0006E23C1D|nr:serine/threonine-protein kinase [Streptomyces sp. NBRC 110028]